MLLVPAGYTLFIDQAPPQGRRGRGFEELIAALAFAIGGGRVAPQPYPFAWPPRGVAYDRAQARDAVLGLMAKLRESRRFEAGDRDGRAGRRAVARLEWRAVPRARVAIAARPPRIDAPLLVTHSAAGLLENPLLKRASWADIQAGRSGGV